jgi:hypothetical protein
MDNDKYIVIELQTLSDGSVANIVTAHDTINEAQSKYHGVLASAAISAVPIHAAVLLDNHGMVLETYAFEHKTAV